MKYTKPNKNKFFTELKTQTDNYFRNRHINKYANVAIAVKGIVLILIYISAYAAIFSPAASTAHLLTAYMVIGISGVMIVFNLVHDASHEAISKNKWINKCVCYIGDLVGINTYIWNIRHNLLHHTFTNVLGGDLIIENIPLIRLSPHQAYKKLVRKIPGTYGIFYKPDGMQIDQRYGISIFI